MLAWPVLFPFLSVLAHHEAIVPCEDRHLRCWADVRLRAASTIHDSRFCRRRRATRLARRRLRPSGTHVVGGARGPLGSLVHSLGCAALLSRRFASADGSSLSAFLRVVSAPPAQVWRPVGRRFRAPGGSDRRRPSWRRQAPADYAGRARPGRRLTPALSSACHGRPC